MYCHPYGASILGVKQNSSIFDAATAISKHIYNATPVTLSITIANHQNYSAKSLNNNTL